MQNTAATVLLKIVFMISVFCDFDFPNDSREVGIPYLGGGKKRKTRAYLKQPKNNRCTDCKCNLFYNQLNTTYFGSLEIPQRTTGNITWRIYRELIYCIQVIQMQVIDLGEVIKNSLIY